MKYTRIGDGVYRASNGMTIKRKDPMSIFGHSMSSSEIKWYIYDANGKYANWTLLLREAKAVVEGRDHGYDFSK